MWLVSLCIAFAAVIRLFRWEAPMATDTPVPSSLYRIRPEPTDAVAQYINLALWALERTRTPVVDLRLPGRYMGPVLAGVRATRPHVRAYVVLWYADSARVLLYRVPAEAGEQSLGKETDVSDFLGGSPVSSPSNPFGKGAGLEPADILPSLDIEGVEVAAKTVLDAFGSAPVVSDSAAERPLNPPTLGGSDVNE